MLSPIAPAPFSEGAPLLLFPLPAGIPIDAADVYERVSLDHMVSHGSDGVMYFRVTGESMRDKGILDGDLIIADKNRVPRTGDIVVAEIDGGFTVKEFRRWRNGLYLAPANKEFETREIREGDGFRVWGVVTYNLKRL